MIRVALLLMHETISEIESFVGLENGPPPSELGLIPPDSCSRGGSKDPRNAAVGYKGLGGMAIVTRCVLVQVGLLAVCVLLRNSSPEGGTELWTFGLWFEVG